MAERPSRPRASGPSRSSKPSRKPPAPRARASAPGVPFEKAAVRPLRKPASPKGPRPPRRRQGAKAAPSSIAAVLCAALAVLLLALAGLWARGSAPAPERPAPPPPAAAAAPVAFRIYNGWTIEKVDAALAERGLAPAGAFREAAAGTAASRCLPFAEGFFLAGDYEVERGPALAECLAEAAALRFMEAARPLFQGVSDSGLSLADCAIIASMISAETQNPSDFPLISSVIRNRLEAGMPLGIDATTRYETGDWTGPIGAEALESRSPYNTRRRPGLPPTGICCPSAATLEAAVFPPETPWLYYRHDSEGRIHLSRTYQEHLRSGDSAP